MTQVGEVFGCADERGLNVLLAPRPGGGAELTVNDAGPGQGALPVMALLLALMALSFVGLSIWKGGLSGLVAALILVVIAAGCQVGHRLDRRRRDKRVRRIADAIAEVAVRARVALDDEGEDDAIEARDVDGAARARALAD